MHNRHIHSEHSRGGRHRARRGAILGAVLTLLAERPMHGYELITELEERSEGRWRPSPGTMYPALKRMAAHDFVSSEEVDGKRQFTLTDAGRSRLAELQAERGDDGQPWDADNTGGRGDLRRHVAELMGQARQIGRFGTPEQIERATAVFETAKRSLYAILAEEPATSAETSESVESDT
ncbi:MAG: DNA-binding PadR family transcriptional regulator [Ilumatobacter sp.]|jgi:DNA-binding PadR family transcriptional regulator